MLVANGPLGHEADAEYASRRVECIELAWHEATKSRLRRRTETGTDVAIDTERGTFLPDGTVLHDDGRRIVVVRRLVEPALVVRFDTGLAPDELIVAAARVGHALGNQHVPVEAVRGALRVPLVTSERVLRRAIAALDVPGVSVAVEALALAASQPLTYGAGHAHGHGEAGAQDDDGDHEHEHGP